MEKNIDDYKKQIVRVLRAHGKYDRGLEAQVSALASALRNLDLANGEIDGLESTTVWEETRYGRKLAPHPAFKIAKEAQDSVTRAAKALGLTPDGLSGGTADDPLADLTRDLVRRRGTGRVLHPAEGGA